MTLIPFGQDKTTGRLVDVSDVSQGAGCNCICPSCNIPLIAKQGLVKEWHFAHTSSHEKDDDYSLCRYSYFASLRMMIRQLLTEERKIYLPSYQKYNPIRQRKITITQPHLLLYEDCCTDVLVDDKHQAYDARIMIKGHPLHVFVSYQAREYRIHPHDRSMGGVLEIDLRRLTLARQKHMSEKSCVAQLRNMLHTHHPCKIWRFHKRAKGIEDKIREENRVLKKASKSDGSKKHPRRTDQLNDLQYNNHSYNNPLQSSAVGENPTPHLDKNKSDPEIAITTMQERPKREEQPKDQPWFCVLCQHDYMGTKIGANPCPKCNEHLYRKMQ